MKIRKRLIALVMMAVMVFGLLPVSAQAADNGMVKLSKNTTYTKYDVTGNGKKIHLNLWMIKSGETLEFI